MPTPTPTPCQDPTCPGAVMHGDSIELHSHADRSPYTDPCQTCSGLGRIPCPNSREEDISVSHERYWTGSKRCPDCVLCLGCLSHFAAADTHDVDGETYCDTCAAGLVTMAQRMRGELPRIYDTIPCGGE